MAPLHYYRLECFTNASCTPTPRQAWHFGRWWCVESANATTVQLAYSENVRRLPTDSSTPLRCIRAPGIRTAAGLASQCPPGQSCPSVRNLLFNFCRHRPNVENPILTSVIFANVGCNLEICVTQRFSFRIDLVRSTLPGNIIVYVMGNFMSSPVMGTRWRSYNEPIPCPLQGISHSRYRAHMRWKTSPNQ